ncbi:ParB/RepB/Spo0J family partition protein [Blastococcus montanus]|uniref:ParB/RepB/Spo0J family partition protein n=1 Tax=Blastococcus montanus TaxID=3144973 RepID=UPI00320B4B96
MPIDSLLTGDSPRLGGENADHVQRLVDCGGTLPPIIVHRADGRIIDGMHRLRAARLRGEHTIQVRYVDCRDIDPFVLAVRLNAQHGLPLTRAERANAARRVITAHPDWSDRMIASLTGLAANTIASIRQRATDDVPQSIGRMGRDGKVRPVLAAPGRERAQQLLAENPTASLRQVARAAGVSLGTAHDVRRRMNAGEDVVPARNARRQAGTTARSSTTELQPAVESRRDLPDWGQMGALLELLKRDPSLRFTEGGRTVLRLFDLQCGFATRQDQVAHSVPAHCGTSIAAIARACAGAWLRFAEELEGDRSTALSVSASAPGAVVSRLEAERAPARVVSRPAIAPSPRLAPPRERALAAVSVAGGVQA